MEVCGQFENEKTSSNQGCGGLPSNPVLIDPFSPASRPLAVCSRVSKCPRLKIRIVSFWVDAKFHGSALMGSRHASQGAAKFLQPDKWRPAKGTSESRKIQGLCPRIH